MKCQVSRDGIHLLASDFTLRTPQDNASRRRWLFINSASSTQMRRNGVAPGSRFLTQIRKGLSKYQAVGFMPS